MSGSGRLALTDVQECSGVPFGWPGVIGRHFRMSGNGREALLEVLKWSKGPHA